MQIECEINGERQMVDEGQLEKRTGTDTDQRASVDWVEYWQGGALVHRSAHINFHPGA